MPPAKAPRVASSQDAGASVVTVTRSGRKVKRRQSNDMDGIASQQTQQPQRLSAGGDSPVKPSPSAALVERRRKLDAARWKADFVLSSGKSPLANFDIRTLLCQPEAWTALDASEQREVLALFPGAGAVSILDPGTADARPDVLSLKNDDNFRHDCARYRSDLGAGFHDKVWLEEAFEAHAMRRAGFFDAYVVEEFEDSWGVEVPEELRPASMQKGAVCPEEMPNKQTEEPPTIPGQTPNDETTGIRTRRRSRTSERTPEQKALQEEMPAAKKQKQGEGRDNNDGGGVSEHDAVSASGNDNGKPDSREASEVRLGSPLPDEDGDKAGKAERRPEPRRNTPPVRRRTTKVAVHSRTRTSRQSSEDR